MALKQDCELQLPRDKDIIETPIAYFWCDEEGIWYSIARPNDRTLEKIKESIKILRPKISSKKICLIADTSRSSYYSIEMREELAHSLSTIVRAIALVPCTSTGKMLATILFKRKLEFPAKIFDDLNEAKEWIKQYCQ
jgi:hypothetical protein